MHDEIFVRQICNEYHGKTLTGLAKGLRITTVTLWRVRCGMYSQNRPYAKNEGANRSIPNQCFGDVLEAAEATKRRK